MTRAVSAWAAFGKKSGKVLRDLRGHYAIYTHRVDAVCDCPPDGEVRAVSIRVLLRAVLFVVAALLMEKHALLLPALVLVAVAVMELVL